MSLELNETSIDIPLGTITALRSAATENAPRVLALHGWLDNAASFIPLAAHLAGIELVAVDLPGHGRSVHLPPGAIYTFEMAVHHVLDIADALGWERFTLLGHSMGAGIASLVAAACPQRVERLVCIEALGGLADAAENTALRMRESGLMVPTWMRPVDAQVTTICPGIECPTRVVFADPAQPYLPDDVRRRYVDALPRGELLALPGTHHLHMETPQAVAEWIGSFLAR
ncbi:MAG: alpha/beta fold hydrolase [Xanthomonadales bacterium]|nr:alpha/beta fold hydrolase [Xanthomonadales bacterium]